MKKSEINMNEVNNVYDSLKELYLTFCNELDEKEKSLDALKAQESELKNFISYLEDNQHSDSFVFSPRGVVGKTIGSHDEKNSETNKVIDYSMKQGKIDELDSILKNQDIVVKEIEDLKNKIALLEKNNILLKDLSQYYCESENVSTPSKEDVYHKFLKMYQSDYAALVKHIRGEAIETLSYLLHMSDLFKKYIDSDPERAKREVSEFNSNIHDVINQLREALDEFLPFVSEKKNYVYALNQIVARVKINSPHLDVILKAEDFDDEENEFFCILILKVILEYSLNASKHSGAKNLMIEIYNKPDTYEIKIKDNGKGFDYDAALQKSNCYGLKVTKEYIEFLNGKLDFRSDEKEGTNISVFVPKGDF